MHSSKPGRAGFALHHRLLATTGWWLALCTLAAAAVAHAEPEVWLGRLGNMPVVMELDIKADGTAEGRYFYRKHHTDISLRGTRDKGGNLLLGENLEYDQKRTDITLHPQGKGWKGEWRGPKANKSLPVSLTPLTDADLVGGVPEMAFRKESSPYDYLRLVDLRIQPGKTEKFNGYTLQWLSEPVSGMRMFRLMDGFPDAVRDKVNRVLAARLWDEVDASFNCRGGRTEMSEYSQTVTPQLLTPRLLSVDIFVSYSCSGAAHPDFGSRPINLDMRSGEELHLEDLLWLGNGPPRLARDQKGKRENFDYENQVLGPGLVRLLTQVYPTEMQPPANASDDDCSYNDPELWSLPSWHIRPKGLYFGPIFPRVMRACEGPEWSVLPWSVVNRHPGRLGGGLP